MTNDRTSASDVDNVVVTFVDLFFRDDFNVICFCFFYDLPIVMIRKIGLCHTTFFEMMRIFEPNSSPGKM